VDSQLTPLRGKMPLGAPKIRWNLPPSAGAGKAVSIPMPK
jgi:hypothetical protein